VHSVIVGNASGNTVGILGFAATLPVAVLDEAVRAAVGFEPLDHEGAVHSLSSELFSMNVVVSVGIEEGPHVLVNHKVDPLNP